MKNTLSLFLLVALAYGQTAYGQTANVQKSLATATLNQISGDLTFGSGKTLTMQSGSTLYAPSLTAPASTALALAAGSGNQNITLTPSGSGVVSIIPVVSSGYSCGLEIYSAIVTAYKIAELRRNGGVGGGEVNLYNDSNQLKTRFGVVGDNYTATALLLGTTTNSANGILQLATHTTSAGGIGFGTDTFLYRSAAGVLNMGGGRLLSAVSGSASSVTFGIVDGTGIYGTSTTLSAATNGTVALTLDASQKATFAGAVRFSTYGAGSATFDSAGNITSVSDARMKNITGPFTKGLAEIVKLNPKLYTWKPETGLVSDDVVASLIAQDIIAAGLPEAVTTYRTVPVMEDDVQSAEDIAAGKPITQHAKLDADGKAVTKRIDANYSVSDRTVIAALVNAVKELKAEIDALKAR